jgi:hypothetical protein
VAPKKEMMVAEISLTFEFLTKSAEEVETAEEEPASKKLKSSE